MSREDISDVVRGLLQNHTSASETRLQNLVFAVDLYSYLTRGEPVTGVEFRPFRYGPYSESVEEELQSLQRNGWMTEKAWVWGRVTTKYLGRTHNPPTDSGTGDWEDVVQDVSARTTSMSLDELVAWSKQTHVYQDTPFEETIDFEQLHKSPEKAQSELERFGSYNKSERPSISFS